MASLDIPSIVGNSQPCVFEIFFYREILIRRIYSYT